MPHVMKIRTLGLFGVLGGSVALNIALIDRIGRLQATITVEHAAQRRELKVGDHVTALDGVLLDGRRRRLQLDDHGVDTILYIFDRTCRFCDMNIANMRALESQTRGRYRFFGVSLGDAGLDCYVSTNGLVFPIFRSVTDDVKAIFGLSATPETILISSTGVVTGVWKGAFTEAIQAAVEDRFGVHLPGVTR